MKSKIPPYQRKSKIPYQMKSKVPYQTKFHTLLSIINVNLNFFILIRLNSKKQ